MRKFLALISLLVILSMLLSACGAAATPAPTQDVKSVVKTEVANQLTLVASSFTPTPIPTSTPTLTNTPTLSPTPELSCQKESIQAAFDKILADFFVVTWAEQGSEFCRVSVTFMKDGMSFTTLEDVFQPMLDAIPDGIGPYGVYLIHGKRDNWSADKVETLDNTSESYTFIGIVINYPHDFVVKRYVASRTILDGTPTSTPTPTMTPTPTAVAQ